MQGGVGPGCGWTAAFFEGGNGCGLNRPKMAMTDGVQLATHWPRAGVLKWLGEDNSRQCGSPEGMSAFVVTLACLRASRRKAWVDFPVLKHGLLGHVR